MLMTNSCWLVNVAESLVVVDAVAQEPSNDLAGFVASKNTIGVCLCLKIHLPVATLVPGGRGTRRCL